MGRLSVDGLSQELRALAAAAAIGTDRVGGDPRAADALLTDAARSGTQGRAGWRPPTLSTRLPPCPPDDRPVAPAPALATLTHLLASGDGALIEEWVDLARAHTVLADAATIPLLLDWCARQPHRSQSIVAVIGHRGTWLAALNPDWHRCLAPPDVQSDIDDLWQLGRSVERLALLGSVRRIDPARARALVESTWTSDSASDRQKFLEALSEGRSLADEPFLEAALDDRSKIVRRQAAAILARLGGSQLRRRMTDAAKRSLSIGGATAKPGAPRLAIVPPMAFDPSWARDGIEERPAAGVGPRAWWLRQIVARAELPILAAHVDLSPASIIAAIQHDDYAGDLLQGFIAAATLYPDEAWSTALVRHLLQRDELELAVLSALVASLPDESREMLTLEILARESISPIERWTLLAWFDRPWSAAFSVAALAALSPETRSGVKDWQLSRAIDAVSRRVSPDALGDFEQALNRVFEGHPTGTAVNSLDRVRRRADMRKEFRS